MNQDVSLTGLSASVEYGPMSSLYQASASDRKAAWGLWRMPCRILHSADLRRKGVNAVLDVLG
jgi:hypothetical protein